MKGHGALVLRHDHSITASNGCHDEIRRIFRCAITTALGLRLATFPLMRSAPVIRDRKPIAAEIFTRANAKRLGEFGQVVTRSFA
nr:hypothetical protein [uncultured Cohaesibacter sp.]